MHPTLIGVAMAGVSLAQTTTSLFYPGDLPFELDGFVVASDRTATTYELHCGKNTLSLDSFPCHPTPITVVERTSSVEITSSTVLYERESTIGLTHFIHCTLASLHGTTGAVCSDSITGNSSFPSPTVTTINSLNLHQTVILTPSPNTDVTTTTSHVTGATGGVTTLITPATTTPSGSGSTASSTSTSASASGSGSGSSSTSTGGLPAVTGNKGLILGGAAVALALIV